MNESDVVAISQPGLNAYFFKPFFLNQAFFGHPEKNLRRKNLKTQGKNSKIKPKAQKKSALF